MAHDWTDEHIKYEGKGKYVAYDEAGLKHSEHYTWDAAKKALVAYDETLKENK